MAHCLRKISFLLGIFLTAPTLAAGDSKGVLHPWHYLGDTVAGSFTGYNLLAQGAGAGVTPVMVASGADAGIRDFFRNENPLGGTGVANTLAFTGNFIHLAPATFMWGTGWYNGDRELSGAGAAGLQAVGLAVVYTQILKWTTGRRAPKKGDPNAGFAKYTRSDDPADFDPRFWSGKDRDGRFIWPSGHTATAFAYVSAMAAYYPNKKWIRWVGYPIALFMGLGILEGDFHWGSDVVAGAVFGTVIGWQSGTHFRGAVSPKEKAGVHFGFPSVALVGREVRIQVASFF